MSFEMIDDESNSKIIRWWMDGWMDGWWWMNGTASLDWAAFTQAELASVIIMSSRHLRFFAIHFFIPSNFESHHVIFSNQLELLNNLNLDSTFHLKIDFCNVASLVYGAFNWQMQRKNYNL